MLLILNLMIRINIIEYLKSFSAIILRYKVYKYCIYYFLIVCFFSFIIPKSLYANGLAKEIKRVQVEDYLVVISVLPPTPRIGNLHISTDIFDLQKKPVLNAVVKIILTDPDGYQFDSVIAYLGLKSPTSFEFNSVVKKPGIWGINIDIQFPLKNENTVLNIPLEIKEPPPFDWWIVTYVFAGIPILISIGWYFRRLFNK